MRAGTLAGTLRRGMRASCLVLGLLLGVKAVPLLWAGGGKELLAGAACGLGRRMVREIWNASELGGGLPSQEGEREQWPDPDPSYRQYQRVSDFYREHDYLEGTEERTEGKDQESPSDFLEAAVSKNRENLPEGSKTYRLEQLADYDFLMKNFYNVHTSTTAGRDLMDAEGLLSRDLSLKKEEPGPQILIYHTHSQEAFADSGPGETVVGVGSRLAELLTQMGYEVYHDEAVYDLVEGKLDRSKAYTYAGEALEQILAEHPSIQVVLDIHRDGVAENLHLASEVNGKSTAQIMFFNGLSQTPEGPVEYLENPYREDNLAFSLQMQLKAQEYFPGYTRKIYLKGLRYNLHFRPRSALVEVGAQTNTYEEALNAMEPLAQLLDMVLQGS